MNSVIEEIAAERQRQIDVEGWTPEHDDEHDDASLCAAASCYALQAALGPGLSLGSAPYPRESLVYNYHEVPEDWPWEPDWWKPKSPRQDLIRAAALIVAEIERIDRAKAKPGPRHISFNPELFAGGPKTIPEKMELFYSLDKEIDRAREDL